MSSADAPRRSRGSAAAARLNGSPSHGVDLGVLPSLLGYQLRLAQRAIFIVRHGEKFSETDERLTEAGHARAQRLASMLKDAGVTAIYSTDTERTLGTVQPLADLLKLTVKIYDTGHHGSPDSRPFVATLRKDNRDGVVVIAGHSNTVPELLRALGCADAITIEAAEYDNLFVVVPKADGTATLVRLRY